MPLWKVSWSAGTSPLLAISGGEDQTVVMAEELGTGQWTQIEFNSANQQQEPTQ